MFQIGEMKRKTKRGDNKFQDVWLQTYDWAKYKNSTHITCTICNKDVAYNNMGESALKSHSKPNETNPTKHQRLAKEREAARKRLSVLHFTDVTNSTKSPSTTTSESTSAVVSPATDSASTSKPASIQPTIEQYALPVNLAKAEILWSMKVILNHFSLRSCLGIGDLFRTMFPDSDVAQTFELSKTKCGYYMNFGLAPYYRNILNEDINRSPFYTAIFDETLNQMVQEEQMDIFIRYWSEDIQMVVTRYFESKFMRRPNAENVVEAIENSLESHSLPKTNLIHVGMDGPSTNWAVLDVLSEHRSESQLPPLEKTGSCGLHIISGSLHTGVDLSGWAIEALLRALFQLFNDSLARRDVYIKLNDDTTFARKFCGTRWVENEIVADRALTVWDKVMKVVDHYEKLCVSKRPKNNKSYERLVSNRHDNLVKVKFCVFRDIASRLNNFLIKFQTDAPLVPFMAQELEAMMRELMSLFITKQTLVDTPTPYMLCKLDVSVQGGNCLPVSDIKLTTAAKSMLKKLKLTGDQKSTFVKEYRNFLIGMVEKIQERTPLKYPIVRAAASLNPLLMLRNETESTLLFGRLVDIMYEHKRVTSKEADDVKRQYASFLEIVVSGNADKFESFNFKKDRLDSFLYAFMGGKQEFQLLWKVTLFVMIISHGQATIERGFNVNKDVVVQNLAKESIRSQRLVYDNIKDIGPVSQIEIPKEMILSCKNARARYAKYLEEKKEKKGDEAQTETSRKRKLKMEEVLEVKRTKSDVDKVILRLQSDIEKFSLEASTRNNFEEMKADLDKAMALRKTLVEKKETAKELETAIGKLEDELKTIRP